MNVFDIVITVFLLFGLVRGIMKGLLIEIASLVALIGGIWGAIHFSYFVGDYLKESVTWTEKQVSLAAFAITFILIIVAVSLLGKFLTKLADIAALGMVNKILGGIFGLLKIGLVLSVLFIFFDRMNSSITFIDKKTIEESILYQPIKSVAPIIFPSVIKGGEIDTDLLETITKKKVNE